MRTGAGRPRQPAPGREAAASLTASRTTALCSRCGALRSAREPRVPETVREPPERAAHVVRSARPVSTCRGSTRRVRAARQLGLRRSRAVGASPQGEAETPQQARLACFRPGRAALPGASGVEPTWTFARPGFPEVRLSLRAGSAAPASPPFPSEVLSGGRRTPCLCACPRDLEAARKETLDACDAPVMADGGGRIPTAPFPVPAPSPSPHAVLNMTRFYIFSPCLNSPNRRPLCHFCNLTVTRAAP